MKLLFEKLNIDLEGKVHTDMSTRLMYATDASVYREVPEAVVFPVNNRDIVKIVRFAGKHNIGIIPRTAGTSLAGQVVGNGMVVDISKHFNNIIEINTSEKWALVQPGVVLEELNNKLAEHGLYFGPETSTANRCMIGGMVGNNACGARSLVYGSTRDHTLEIEAVLADGSVARFGALSPEAFEAKCAQDNLEGQIYRDMHEMLKPQDVRDNLLNNYPDQRLKRRNTGYALDILTKCQLFDNKMDTAFNFCKLLCGSEGTLAFYTAIKLNLVPLPAKHKALLCAHFNNLEEALQANLIALEHNPVAIELMDKTILDCTKANAEQRKNRFFLHGEPEAILIIEFVGDDKEAIENSASKLIGHLQNEGFGYAYPVVRGGDIKKVWNLRKAGLGVLANIQGDAKPVSVIEDTAVHPEHLPAYIKDFKAMLAKHRLSCVYHAHIATGELHLRPVLNLKDKGDLQKFRMVAHETAYLVKKYKGSLSGEHGDGRLRGEFIPIIIGDDNYKLLMEVKKIWDANHIFNPGKIVRTPLMDESLRYETGRDEPSIKTMYRYPEGGILQLAEKCNGTGDCRKSAAIGGTMCPSYQATRDEYTTTRARANILREYLTHSKKHNRFNHQEIMDVLDLCLSCKGCKTECPSNVDVAKMKSEFLHQYYKSHRVPFRSWSIAHIYNFNQWMFPLRALYNIFSGNNGMGNLVKKVVGFHPKRSMPILQKTKLSAWYNSNSRQITYYENNIGSKGQVVFFIDEFSQYYDVEIGKKAISLLHGLGYNVQVFRSQESGRAAISKGLLNKAKKLANDNVHFYADKVNKSVPLVGIEPSAILTFRDEYPDLVDNELVSKANALAKNVYMLEEFLENEINKGNIDANHFTDEAKTIHYHGHCQQKAIASSNPSLKILSFPKNYTVVEIDSGCCGMAGSFGFEKEHFDLSMKVGGLKLFPAVRKAGEGEIISASGTSCRHQIYDGTGKRALHPVEVLYDAWLNK